MTASWPSSGRSAVVSKRPRSWTRASSDRPVIRLADSPGPFATHPRLSAAALPEHGAWPRAPRPRRDTVCDRHRHERHPWARRCEAPCHRRSLASLRTSSTCPSSDTACPPATRCTCDPPRRQLSLVPDIFAAAGFTFPSPFCSVPYSRSTREPTLCPFRSAYLRPHPSAIEALQRLPLHHALVLHLLYGIDPYALTLVYRLSCIDLVYRSRSSSSRVDPSIDLITSSPAKPCAGCFVSLILMSSLTGSLKRAFVDQQHDVVDNTVRIRRGLTTA